MNDLNSKFLALVQDTNNWPKLQDVIDAATRVVGDFDEYGEVLQSNGDGIYDQYSNIEQLRGMLIRFDVDTVRSGDFFPHLTDAQQERLKTIAVEVIMAADGDKSPPREIAEDDVDLMTPYERLVATGWYDRGSKSRAELEKRLGFDPISGKNTV